MLLFFLLSLRTGYLVAHVCHVCVRACVFVYVWLCVCSCNSCCANYSETSVKLKERLSFACPGLVAETYVVLNFRPPHKSWSLRLHFV